jgi:hypothetical protein
VSAQRGRDRLLNRSNRLKVRIGDLRDREAIQSTGQSRNRNGMRRYLQPVRFDGDCTQRADDERGSCCPDKVPSCDAGDQHYETVSRRRATSHRTFRCDGHAANRQASATRELHDADCNSRLSLRSTRAA